MTKLESNKCALPLFSWHFQVGLQTKGHKALEFLGKLTHANLEFIAVIF